MIKSNNEQKDKINILLNVSNFYGKHTGNISRILLFCLSAFAPLLLYALLIQGVPVSAAGVISKVFFIVYIPYVIKMALITIGREKERLDAYVKRLNDEYATAKELIRFSDVHEDGLIEYQNGTICYVIQAYGYSYMDDNKYSKDLEEFISKLTYNYDVDVYGHLVTGELGTKQEDLEKLRVYTDKEFMHERLEFYKYQDEYTNRNTKLYRLNFVVRSYKNKWGKLKKDITTLLASEYIQCFDYVKLCNKQEVIDVASRDITLYVDLGEMLRSKHSSDNYFGSKVLYFGDEAPDELKVKERRFDEEEGRRVINDK